MTAASRRPGIAEIAAAAAISRPTFYFYFESKQALLKRLVEKTLDELIGRHWSHIRCQDRAIAAELHAALHHGADMWIDHGAVLEAAADRAAANSSIFERIAAVIESGADASAQALVNSGSTPAVADVATARDTAVALGWMCERNFYVLARRGCGGEEFHALADRLFRIWMQVVGISADDLVPPVPALRAPRRRRRTRTPSTRLKHS